MRGRERLRPVPDQMIEEFKPAGSFRMSVPKRHGGYELEYGIAQIEPSRYLDRTCGTTARLQAVVPIHAWIVMMPPELAQDAVR